MKFVQVTVVVAALSGYAFAAGYGGGVKGVDDTFSRSADAPASQPYRFDYNAVDQQGNSHYRREQGDARGTVRGSYGYTDAQGRYSVIDFLADENGVRTNIRSNEPGSDGKEIPANIFQILEPIPGLPSRYPSSQGTGGTGTGDSGYGYGAGGAGVSGRDFDNDAERSLPLYGVSPGGENAGCKK